MTEKLVPTIPWVAGPARAPSALALAADGVLSCGPGTLLLPFDEGLLANTRATVGTARTQSAVRGAIRVHDTRAERTVLFRCLSRASPLELRW